MNSLKEIYVFDHKKQVRLHNGNLVVVNQEKEIEVNLNIDRIKSVNILGNAQVSTQVLKALAYNGKSVHYYTKHGKYVCSMNESSPENYERQELQILAIQNEDFRNGVSKRILANKINLQSRLLKAYDEDNIVLDREYNYFKEYRNKILESDDLNQMLGYEGRAAKAYFYNIALLIHEDFRFKGRSKRPPLNPFNAMISFGYSILYGNIRGAIVKSGLNMGFGFIHKNRNKHAALVSDLMEEWRSIIIDDTVLQLVNNQKVNKEDFKKSKTGTIYMKNGAKQTFLNALNQRMFEGHYYFMGENKKFTFISGLDMQIHSLIRAIDHKKCHYYKNIGEAEKNYV